MKFIALNVIRHTLNYDTMRRFYGEALGFPVIESWDEGTANRGTVFGISGGGTLEVLHLGDVPQPAVPIVNLDVVIQVDDAHAWHDHLHAKGVTIARGLETQEWGHRSFGVDDPDGLRLWFVEHLKAE